MRNCVRTKMFTKTQGVTRQDFQRSLVRFSPIKILNVKGWDFHWTPIHCRWQSGQLFVVVVVVDCLLFSTSIRSSNKELFTWRFSGREGVLCYLSHKQPGGWITGGLANRPSITLHAWRNAEKRSRWMATFWKVFWCIMKWGSGPISASGWTLSVAGRPQGFRNQWRHRKGEEGGEVP